MLRLRHRVGSQTLGLQLNRITQQIDVRCRDVIQRGVIFLRQSIDVFLDGFLGVRLVVLLELGAVRRGQLLRNRFEKRLLVRTLDDLGGDVLVDNLGGTLFNERFERQLLRIICALLVTLGLCCKFSLLGRSLPLSFNERVVPGLLHLGFAPEPVVNLILRGGVTLQCAHAAADGCTHQTFSDGLTSHTLHRVDVVTLTDQRAVTCEAFLSALRRFERGLRQDTCGHALSKPLACHFTCTEQDSLSTSSTSDRTQHATGYEIDRVIAVVTLRTYGSFLGFSLAVPFL